MDEKLIEEKIIILVNRLENGNPFQEIDDRAILRLVVALGNEPNIARQSAWALKELGPRIEDCRDLPANTPEIFVRAYIKRMLLLRNYKTAVPKLAEIFDNFSQLQLKIASSELLRSLLVGKSKAQSLLKRVVRRIAQMALDWMAFCDPPPTDDELIAFIRENVRKLYEAERNKERDEKEKKKHKPDSRRRYDFRHKFIRQDSRSICDSKERVLPPKPPMDREEETSSRAIAHKPKLKPKPVAPPAAVPPPPPAVPPTVAGGLVLLEDFVEEREKLVEKKPPPRPARRKAREKEAEEVKEAKPLPEKDREVEDRRKARGKKKLAMPALKPPALEQEKVSEETRAMAAPKMRARKKISPLLLLTLPFRLLSLPFVGAVYLVRRIYLGLCSLKQKFLGLCKGILQKLKDKAAKSEIPVFELLLGEDAGRPGPVERLAAQSVIIMKGLQVTLGLKFILIANALDMVLEMVTAYINGIFRSWKMMKTVKRRMARAHSGGLAAGVADDLAVARTSLSRLFCFSGFYPERCQDDFLSEESRQAALDQTFPLKLALEIRGHLDEMKRDLSMLTSEQIRQFLQGSLKDFIISFFPNPLDMLTPCKDLFILTFFMRYSRREIEKMYVALLLHYSETIEMLEKEDQTGKKRKWKQKWMDHEERLLKLLSSRDYSGNTLEQSIEQNRRDLQRLLQVLCNPGQFIDPRKWSRVDLLRETDTMWERHPKYELELERWLGREVHRALSKEGVKPDSVEQRLRLFEARDFRYRYRLQRRFGKQFVVS